MKTLQLFLLKMFGFAILTGGMLLAWFRFSELHAGVLELVQQYVPSSPVLCAGVASLLVALGLAALLPMKLSIGKDRSILVPSASGNNYIRLGPIEANLNRSLRKLPSVKRIFVTLVPAEGDRKVRVSADVTLRKGLTAGAREVVSRLNDQVMAHTKRELGDDEVMSVELTIIGGLGISAPSPLGAAANSTPNGQQGPPPLDVSQDADESDALPGFDEESSPEEDSGSDPDSLESPDEDEDTDY